MLWLFALRKNVSGAGYIILNCIRVMNIIALLAVIVASFVMLVRTFVVSKFYVFDSFSHVITAVLGIFLVVSELSIFKKYFAHNWPLLSNESGFVTLGVLMLILGVSILGNLNKDATSQASLGLSFWQIVIASGIVSFILGVMNIVASYVFRKRKANVTARMVRAHGATAPQRAADVLYTSKGLPTHSPSVRTVVSDRTPRRSFSAPMERVPSYHSPPRRSSSRYSNSQYGGLNISQPINENPDQFAKFKGSEDIARPDTAAHPAFQGGRF